MIAGGQTQTEQGVNKEQFKPVDNAGIYTKKNWYQWATYRLRNKKVSNKQQC